MIHIFYSSYADASMYQGSSCRGFTLLLQLLKSKNSVGLFAFSANMSKLLLILRWFLAKMRRLLNRQTDSSLLFPLPMKALVRYVSPRVYTIHSPFWLSSHIWRYKDILSRKSSLKDTSISVIFWTFLLEKLINSVDQQSSGHSSAAGEIIVEIYAGTRTTWIKVCKASFSVN